MNFTCMVPLGTVKLLSQGMGESPGKQLPETDDRGQEFTRDSPHTEGQQIDCTRRSHGINVLLPNVLYNFYKIYKCLLQ